MYITVSEKFHVLDAQRKHLQDRLELKTGPESR